MQIFHSDFLFEEHLQVTGIVLFTFEDFTSFKHYLRQICQLLSLSL